MKRFISLALMAALACSCTQKVDPLRYVDPFIGTGGHGHTYPGATVPRGAVQLSPDTRIGGWDACGGYHYSDSTILGFSHTHLSGTGVADLSDLLFYPATGLERPDSRPAHIFSHSDEKASAGYYSVFLSDAGIRAELTATPHVGVHRYTFEGDEPRQLVIDLHHCVTDEIVDLNEIRQVSPYEIAGVKRSQGWVSDQWVYFDAKFTQPICVFTSQGDSLALVEFALDADELVCAVALSSVSAEGAALNLATELPGSTEEEPVIDFDAVKASAEGLWRDELGKISVKGGSEKELTCLYTALYHTAIVPNRINDVDGQYRASDGSIVKTRRNFYSTLSFWDTFRAWHPLQILTDTTLVCDIVRSAVNFYEHSGELPMWPLASGETGCMIGYHSASVIADAYLRGVKGFDAEYALTAMVASSMKNPGGSQLYLDYGYVPSDRHREAVSITLEFAYDDWCIAMMARGLGHNDVAEMFFNRARSWQNIFDGGSGFFRGRNADGQWVTPFDPFVNGRDFTEGIPWHYRFFVPHDIYGLKQFFGGDEKFLAALDDLFTLESDYSRITVADVSGMVGQYAHGNEPSHHMAYLYNYAGAPWKTQALTRRLLSEMYNATPDGLIGNEDCGQMSAWYVMSALGLYSLCPGSGEYELTSPLFGEATIRMASGNALTIKVDHPKWTYIYKVCLNGKPVEGNTISYDDLMAGGTLEFKMSREPVLSRAGAVSGPSMSTEAMAAVPGTTVDPYLFVDSLSMDLVCATDGAQIRYTEDGSEPTESSALYNAPLPLTQSKTIKAKAFAQGLTPSPTATINAVKAEFSPAANVSGLKEGVAYSYYEGQFSRVADLLSARPVEKGVMAQPSIASARLSDHFGFIYEGYISVPERGVWEFCTVSDDGSVLEVDGQEVVNNDGGHAAINSSGRIALEKGLHRFRLLYFEDYEGEALSWSWKSPATTSFTPIPTEALFH